MSTRPVFSLLLGFLAMASPAIADSQAWLHSVREALDQAKANDQLILVDLYADWCGWCKQLESEVFSTQAFRDFTRDMVLLRVDTEDGGEGTRLQEKYGAFSLPTTLILDHRQVRIAEIRGFSPVDVYLRRIEQEIAVYRELEDGVRRFGQSSDTRVLAILSDELHQRGDGERAAELYRRMLTTGQLSPEREIQVRFQLTDALRLARRFDDCLEELQTTRRAAEGAGDRALVERLDFLAAQVALDRGDCQQARAVLEAFLGEHPKSGLRRTVRRTLATLEAQGFRCT